MELWSGELVVDRHQSHLHQGVVSLLPEALTRIDSRGRLFLVEEVDFDRPIGQLICVVTGPGDEIVFAKRPKRLGFSRFVVNRHTEESSKLTVVLRAGSSGEYVIVTAFVGPRAEPEPWDGNATANSRAFWSSHALIWGCEETVPGTETNVCPW